MARSFEELGFWKLMKSSFLFDEGFAKDNKDWLLIKDIYERNYLTKLSDVDEGFRIPKIIHQVWLGGELPEKYREWGNTWKKFHPGWEYKLWTDREADGFEMTNRELYDKVDNLGAKSDIFRLEILYKYGGVYVDTDFECLKPFDHLCKMTSLFAGLAYSKEVLAYNGLIGASRKNPMVAACIESLKETLYNYDRRMILSSEEIMARTGPDNFTKVLLAQIKTGRVDLILFPVTFFYCFPNNERFKGNDEQIVRSYVCPESYAIHYWSTAWVVKMGLVNRIKRILWRVIYGR